jgi:PAS domain S-box-containing protein
MHARVAFSDTICIPDGITAPRTCVTVNSSSKASSQWSLSLGYGRRRQRLLLIYLLPFALVVAAISYGIVKELHRANVVFDRLNARLRAFGSLEPAALTRFPEVVATRTIGLDALPSEPDRRTAAEEARDRGIPIVTSRIEQGNLEIFRPRYRTAAVPGNLHDRRQAVTGWTFVIFRPEQLIRIVAQNRSTRVDIDITDVRTSSLIATNAPKQTSPDTGNVGLRFPRTIQPFGRPWLVRQTRNSSIRAVLLDPETLLWLVVITLPVIFFSRRYRSRRSFELGPTMLDALVDVIEVVDLDGCIVYTSPSITKNFGYVPGDVINREFVDLVHPDDAVAVRATFERATTSDDGEVFDEFRLRDRSGVWRHAEGTARRITVRGKVIATFITMHDVTSVVSAENALWVSEEKFWRLFESITDYAISIVDLAGNISSWNRGAERMTGYSSVDAIGNPLSILYPHGRNAPEDATQQQGVQTEDWLLRRDGTRFLAEVIRSPMTDRQGQVTGFSVIMRDVTERRMIEAQVSQAQRLDSLGKLAGGIAHDFNNMLMVISSRAELLLRGVDIQANHRRYVEDIKSAASKSRDLTQQLLAAARQQVLQPEVIDLNEVISSTMRLLRSSIGEDIDIRMDLKPSLWPVFADPGKLHQVLMNLALNARDAMPDGGTLTIETRNFHAAAFYVQRHPQLQAGDHVLLLVSDRGKGIAPEDQPRIYDPFFSTKSTGTGLGLSVVRGIVEQTGGQIWLYSEVGV